MLVVLVLVLHHGGPRMVLLVLVLRVLGVLRMLRVLLRMRLVMRRRQALLGVGVVL